MIQTNPTDCADCGCKRVDKLIWHRLPAERRRELRKGNRYNRADSSGRCHRCACAARRRRDNGPRSEPRPYCSECGAKRCDKSARGLCKRCYSKASRDGTLVDHERASKPAAEVLAEWQQLADSTAPLMVECKRLAPRLGMRPETLAAALRRAGVRSAYGPGGYVHKGAAA